MYVGTGVSTLNDTLHVKPLFQLQTARGDPSCLCDARGTCLMLKDTSWHLLAAVCSHGVLIRCLRFWTSLLDDQSVLSLKDTSSRSLCGPMAFERCRTKRYRGENEYTQQSTETSERHEDMRSLPCRRNTMKTAHIPLTSFSSPYLESSAPDGNIPDPPKTTRHATQP